MTRTAARVSPDRLVRLGSQGPGVDRECTDSTGRAAATKGTARVAVVIPNWNGIRHLPECLDSLAQQVFTDFEVLVVDNGSTDRSLDFIRERYPAVRVLSLGENKGFAGAVNAGIRASDAEYVVLLNNDTSADPNWLASLVAAMDQVAEASFGASKMLLYDHPDLIDSAGDGFSIRRWAGVNLGSGEPASRYRERAWVFGACAGAAVYRRSLFEDIGLFDEDFFLTHEDVDLDMRAQLAGHRCLYVPEAVVYHKRGGSTDRAAAEFHARALRNRIWVAGKALPLPLLILWACSFLPGLAWAFVRGLIGRIGARLRGGEEKGCSRPAGVMKSVYVAEVARALRCLREKRASVQRARRIGSLRLLGILLRRRRPVASWSRQTGSAKAGDGDSHGGVPTGRTAARVARNASYSLVANAVAFVAGVASSVVLARLLGPAGLGTYALVLSAAGILGMGVILGVPHAATKYVAEYVARGDRETAGRVLLALARFEVLMALAIAISAILVAPWLERAFHAPGFTPAFRIAAIGLLPGAVGGVAGAGLAGLQDFRTGTLISIASTSFLFATTVGLLAAGTGVTGAIAAMAMTGLVSGALAWRAVHRHMPLSVRRVLLPPPARAKLRRYVPAVSVVLLLDAVVWQRSEVFFLGAFRTPREVAWYALAFGVSTGIMRLLPRALSAVLAPVASGLYGAGDRAGMHALFRIGSRYLCILAAPLAAGGAVLARPFFTAVYGGDYAPAAAAFPLVLLAAGFGAVGSVTAAIQNGIERQDLILKVALAATVVNLGLDVALIPGGGVVGAAVANLVAQAGAVIAGIALTARVIGASFPLGDCLRALLASAVAAGVAYPLVLAVGGAAGLAAAALAGAAVYPAALLAAGALRAEDLERLSAAESVLPRGLRSAYSALLRLAATAAPARRLGPEAPVDLAVQSAPAAGPAPARRLDAGGGPR